MDRDRRKKVNHKSGRERLETEKKEKKKEMTRKGVVLVCEDNNITCISRTPFHVK